MSGRSQPKRSLILDPVNPRDHRRGDLVYACEQCSHFDPTATACTLGYEAANHVRARQARTYELLGRIAFCRFLEID